MKNLALVIFYFILFHPVFAQVNPSPDSLGKTLETLVIGIDNKRISNSTPSNTGRNVEVITSQELMKLPVQSTIEALSFIAGVDIRQRGPLGAQADITIGGGTFEQVLILVNGIPLRDPQTGHHQLNLPFDLQQIERIEITKGTASRIYGANALAGAINIITKAPAQEKAYFQSYAASSFETDTASGETYYASGIRAGAGFKIKSSQHRLDAGYQTTNGYRYNSSSTQQRINYLGRFLTEKSQWDLMAGTLFNEFGARDFYAPPVDIDAVESVNTSYAGLRGNIHLGQLQLRPIAYWRYNHDDYNLNAFDYRNNHFSTAAGSELHATYSLENWTFGAGVEYRTELIRSNNLGKHDRSYYAAYAEAKYQYNKLGSVTLGTNVQYNTDFDLSVYPGIEFYQGFRLRASNILGVFSNAGFANRMPTYTDLYYSDSRTVGNPLLQPEAATNIEAGFRYQTSIYNRFQASAFIRDATDFIDFVREDINSKFQPRNFQNVEIRGVELSALQMFPTADKHKIYPSSLRMTYTYLDGTLGVQNSLSRYALEHLRHQLSIQLVVKTSNKIDHTFSMRYFERFKGQEYGLADYRVRFNLKHWSVFGDISNIFDREYIETGFVTMPGRWYRIGVELRLK